MTGNVVGVFICGEPGGQMRALDEAEVVAGKGIVGDRYFFSDGKKSKAVEYKPDREITLVEAEQIESFNDAYEMRLALSDTRRNVVTRGADLNSLVGVDFEIGDVRLRGHRLCEPCKYLADMVAKDILPGLVHKAGLRAQILEGGKIRPNDAVVISINT